MIDTIMTRRSVRKFTGEPVDEKDMELVLRAGFQAPSAHNREPREYIVIRDKEILEEIASSHKYAKMASSAGTAIVVLGDREKEEREGFLVQDCAASIENMLIAINALGLGGVWVGIYPVEESVRNFRKILNIGDRYIPISMVVLGHKPEDLKEEYIDRYNEDKIHFDKC